MKTVYLVRHGEAENNLRFEAGTPEADAQIYLGYEARLTTKGRAQAAQLAERAEHLPIEAIIASSMDRAVETARIVGEKVGLPVETSEYLVERKSPSTLIGRKWNDPVTQKGEEAWLETVFTSGTKYLDGENFDELLDRGKHALDFLEQRKEDEILVVTHGFFLRVLVGIVMLGDTFTANDLLRIDHTLVTRNTGITVIRRGAHDTRKDNAIWHVLTWNDHAHLG